MKRIIILSIMLSLCWSAYGEAPKEGNTKESFIVRITNSKGKPIKANDIYIVKNGDTKMIEESKERGVFRIENLKDSDTLSIVLKNGVYKIPVLNMDSIQFSIKNWKLQSNDASLNRLITDGFSTISQKINVTSISSLKARDNNNYANLAEYLKGRVAGVIISGSSGNYSANIRGKTSMHSGTEPLVIADGMDMGGFNKAVLSINVSDIDTVTVLKDGSMYGIRGANGVIVITTKKRN